MDVYDLLVIGSGAGLNVAVEAAQKGLKVCIVEKGPLGGTCLNRGCIPSKIVIHSAEVAETISRAKEFGLKASFDKVNFKYVTNRANKTVDADARSIAKNLKRGKNPKLIQGEAKFIAPYIVQVGRKQIKGKKVLIASGARPFIPPIEGLDKIDYMTSTEALRQTKLPESMIVIGGGYIGAELGNFYGALGCKVTILQRGDFLIPREDEDIAYTFTKIMKKKYNVVTNASASSVSKKKGKIIVKAKVGRRTKTFSAEKLLVATGVRPNTDLLNVAATGVKTNKRGFIKVNKFMETSQKNIWALGDISGVFMFRHSANLEADFAAVNILNKKKQAVDYFPMPHAVFSSPEIAGVGLTEQEVKEKKINYVIGLNYYKNTGKGVAINEKEGFCKIIVARKSRKILGCHILGPNASILIHEVLIAMKSGKGLDLLRNVVHIHPALSEVVQRAARNVPI